MSIDLSKLCADFLRQNHASHSTEKLKASHARELVAAFFGYKSHAALMAEKTYPLDQLEEAYIFVPDIPLMNDRRKKLGGLPDNLVPSMDIGKLLSGMLSDEGLCGGNIWLYDTLETYIAEVLLPDCQTLIDDQLSGTMAETNAGFFDSPYYDDVQLEDRGDELVAIAKTQYKGQPLDDKPFCGDTIDMVVQVRLPRMAGKRGFYDFELEVGGSVNDDWVDPDLKYGKPPSNLALELGIREDELDLLEYDVQENSSDDGLIYDFILVFHEHNPPEIMDKIEGLSDDLTVRVSVNAFDDPPEPFDGGDNPKSINSAPNARPKEQWLEMTGGFRFGETPEQFQRRQVEIHALRNRIAQGQATPSDVDRLSQLLGTDQDDEFSDMF